MNRRGFLGLLGGAAIVAPELVRAYFLPPRGGWPRSSMDGDFTTANMRYRAHERFSHGFTDPKGCFGYAPLKPEGGQILYDRRGHDDPFLADGVPINSVSHPEITRDFDELIVPEELNEAALERVCLEFKNLEARGVRVRIDPKLIDPNTWYLKTEHLDGLKLHPRIQYDVEKTERGVALTNFRRKLWQD